MKGADQNHRQVKVFMKQWRDNSTITTDHVSINPPFGPEINSADKPAYEMWGIVPFDGMRQRWVPGREPDDAPACCGAFLPSGMGVTHA